MCYTMSRLRPWGSRPPISAGTVMKKHLLHNPKHENPEWWETAPAAEKRRVKRRFKKREKRLIEQQCRRDGG